MNDRDSYLWHIAALLALAFIAWELWRGFHFPRGHA